MGAHDELDSILDAERSEARAARDHELVDDGPTAADVVGLRLEREPAPVEPAPDDAGWWLF